MRGRVATLAVSSSGTDGEQLRADEEVRQRRLAAPGLPEEDDGPARDELTNPFDALAGDDARDDDLDTRCDRGHRVDLRVGVLDEVGLGEHDAPASRPSRRRASAVTGPAPARTTDRGVGRRGRGRRWPPPPGRLAPVPDEAGDRAVALQDVVDELGRAERDEVTDGEVVVGRRRYPDLAKRRADRANPRSMRVTRAGVRSSPRAANSARRRSSRPIASSEAVGRTDKGCSLRRVARPSMTGSVARHEDGRC